MRFKMGWLMMLAVLPAMAHDRHHEDWRRECYPRRVVVERDRGCECYDAPPRRWYRHGWRACPPRVWVERPYCEEVPGPVVRFQFNLR